MSWFLVRLILTVNSKDECYAVVIDRAFHKHIVDLLKERNEKNGTLRIQKICFIVGAPVSRGSVNITPVDGVKDYTDTDSLISTVKRVLDNICKIRTRDYRHARKSLKERPEIFQFL